MNKYRLTELRWVWIGLAAAGLVFGWQRWQRSQKTFHWHRLMVPNGWTALVTGASAGIGAAYARRLAQKGYSLVLVARRQAKLEILAEGLRADYKVQVEVLPADLSSEEGIQKIEARINSRNDIDFLVNSAGYDVYGYFAEIPIADNLKLINCLELVCVRASRAALPGMLARRRGAIVNVSSIGALIPKFKDVTYTASKAFLNMFSRSLRMELAGSGVRVQALCPGFTWTEFHDAPEYAQYHIKERIPRWMWMSPEAVVKASLKVLGEDRVVCIPGIMNQVAAAIGRSGVEGAATNLLRWIMGTARQMTPRSDHDILGHTSCIKLQKPERGEL